MYLSSISSEEYATIDETKQLNLCKINQVIYTIRSTIDNDNNNEEEILDNTNILEPTSGFDQIFVQTILYEVMMRLFSFYLLIVNNRSLFTLRLDDAQKWLSIPTEIINILICHELKTKESYKIIKTHRSLLTQQSGLFISLIRHNSMSSSHNVSPSPKVTSPVYTNTTNKQPQSPPVPAKSKYRASNTQLVGINGDNHTQRKIQ
ncbi:unnamed protein product [Rotaria sordida]|uniref:Uncharacterized protein n=1 Tax=Rotaria sordida TaxID=392033 RepID=A0A816EEQ3_9BILA|nr:unnamed protein product [Rotaria sordida]CAF1648779.1 unnamed protein product [Rotaria sordida]